MNILLLDSNGQIVASFQQVTAVFRLVYDNQVGKWLKRFSCFVIATLDEIGAVLPAVHTIRFEQNNKAIDFIVSHHQVVFDEVSPSRTSLMITKDM